MEKRALLFDFSFEATRKRGTLKESHAHVQDGAVRNHMFCLG